MLSFSDTAMGYERGGEHALDLAILPCEQRTRPVPGETFTQGWPVWRGMGASKQGGHNKHGGYSACALQRAEQWALVDKRMQAKVPPHPPNPPIHTPTHTYARNLLTSSLSCLRPPVTFPSLMHLLGCLSTPRRPTPNPPSEVPPSPLVTFQPCPIIPHVTSHPV